MEGPAQPVPKDIWAADRAALWTEGNTRLVPVGLGGSVPTVLRDALALHSRHSFIKSDRCCRGLDADCQGDPTADFLLSLGASPPSPSHAGAPGREGRHGWLMGMMGLCCAQLSPAWPTSNLTSVLVGSGDHLMCCLTDLKGLSWAVGQGSGGTTGTFPQASPSLPGCVAERTCGPNTSSSSSRGAQIPHAE